MTTSLRFARTLLLAIAIAALVTACGGTKVYDSTKTIVYKGNIYQVTDVQQISTKIEGIKADKSRVNLKSMDKNGISDLIKAEDELFVRMVFELDEQELVYVATDVDSYRDYSRLEGRFEKAGKDIAKLMAAKKTEQLNLK